MIQTVYLDIKKRIEKEEIPAMKIGDRLPGVGNLADKFGVSLRTVSKALWVLQDEGAVIIKGTRGTFVANRKINRKLFRRLACVGMIDEVNTHEMQVLDHKCHHDGFELVNLNFGAKRSGVTASFWHDLPVDGVIFTNSTLTDEIAENLTIAGKSFVSCNSSMTSSSYDWVDFNHGKMIKDAVTCARSQGHDRIAFVACPTNLPEFDDFRRAIFKEALGESFDPSLWWLRETHNNLFKLHGSKGLRMYGEKTAKVFANMERPPTAAVIIGEEIAEGMCAYAEAESSTTSMPLLITTSTRSPSKAKKHSYTRIYLPIRKRMLQACRILFSRINQQSNPPIHELLTCELEQP